MNINYVFGREAALSLYKEISLPFHKACNYSLRSKVYYHMWDAHFPWKTLLMEQKKQNNWKTLTFSQLFPTEILTLQIPTSVSKHTLADEHIKFHTYIYIFWHCLVRIWLRQSRIYLASLLLSMTVSKRCQAARASYSPILCFLFHVFSSKKWQEKNWI